MANTTVLSTVATFERKSSEGESAVGERPHRTNTQFLSRSQSAEPTMPTCYTANDTEWGNGRGI
jgi:hypothetical protein